MRISVDIGGTFTDLVVEGEVGPRLFKAPTVPSDPVNSVFDVLEVAASTIGCTLEELLRDTELFIHATTRALNAVLTQTTARTAFLTTEGHPDVLLLREGGREDPFDFTVPFPEPFVPRALTYEVPERISSSGAVIKAVDDRALDEICDALSAENIEAVAVCLLWSTVNPTHELRVGDRLAQRLPGVPYTLSHQLNPTLREYRRASSTCINASLQPIMTDYLTGASARLRAAGFAGRLLMVTSIGGVLDIEDVAEAPIHCINSGPSMAPIAGRAFAREDADSDVVIVADAGGTTYDVTLVRDGRIPWTRETWIGPRYVGHMTGFPSIDVKSVGAGGGSIAWVDSGGLLHVGPQSAGSVPGPACYGRGGTDPTVTDAALVLGYLDPDLFSGGSMRLDAAAAVAAVRRGVGAPLEMGDVVAADAVMQLTTEQMVRAIEEITLQQGIDAAGAVLVGGGGAAGLNAVWVARRLGCRRLIIPEVGAALAAAGALISDLMAAYAVTVSTASDMFAMEKVNTALAKLHAMCQAFIERAGVLESEPSIEMFAEAHYPQQVWDLEVLLRVTQFADDSDVRDFVADFHSVHEQVLGISDRDAPVEMITWGARVQCPLRGSGSPLSSLGEDGIAAESVRTAYFPEIGVVATPVRTPASIGDGEVLKGPVIVESAFTTIVIPAGSACERSRSGSLLITPGSPGQAHEVEYAKSDAKADAE